MPPVIYNYDKHANVYARNGKDRNGTSNSDYDTLMVPMAPNATTNGAYDTSTVSNKLDVWATKEADIILGLTPVSEAGRIKLIGQIRQCIKDKTLTLVTAQEMLQRQDIIYKSKYVVEANTIREELLHLLA